MRKLSCLSVILILSCMFGGLNAQVPTLQPHPPVELDVASQPDAAWTSMDNSCHVSFATTDIAYGRHEVPKLPEEIRSWSGTAWRGERIHAQILVWSKLPLTQLRAEPTALVGVQGQTIPSAALRVRGSR